MNQYFEGFTEDYELNDGERDFYVKEFDFYFLYLSLIEESLFHQFLILFHPLIKIIYYKMNN